MTRLANLVEDGELSDYVDAAGNREVLAYLEQTQPSCHSDNASVLVDAAVAKCGEWIGYSPSFESYKYIALITNRKVFALGLGMGSVYFKLPEPLLTTALATGAILAEQIGKHWVEVKLFRPDWPAPDVVFWTLKAYAAARHPNS